MFSTLAIERAIQEFLKHFEKKIRQGNELKKIADALKEFNGRQIALLQYLNEHKGSLADINTHKNKHGVAYQTARSDLIGLERNDHVGKCAGYQIALRVGYKRSCPHGARLQIGPGSMALIFPLRVSSRPSSENFTSCPRRS
jgi:hypothetical protein